MCVFSLSRPNSLDQLMIIMTTMLLNPIIHLNQAKVFKRVHKALTISKVRRTNQERKTEN